MASCAAGGGTQQPTKEAKTSGCTQKCNQIHPAQPSTSIHTCASHAYPNFQLSTCGRWSLRMHRRLLVPLVALRLAQLFPCAECIRHGVRHLGRHLRPQTVLKGTWKVGVRPGCDCGRTTLTYDLLKRLRVGPECCMYCVMH